MTFDQFQQECLVLSAFKSNPNFDLKYWGLALAGEAGEVADEIKKCIRDENFILTEERRQLMLNEMANVLYYLSRMATELEVGLEALAIRQIELTTIKKLQKERETQ